MKTILLKHVPARATAGNIKDILATMEAVDKRADRAYQKGDFSRATQLSDFVFQLDTLVARYNGELPLKESK